jgi:hypothetical protein
MQIITKFLRKTLLLSSTRAKNVGIVLKDIVKDFVA